MLVLTTFDTDDDQVLRALRGGATAMLEDLSPRTARSPGRSPRAKSNAAIATELHLSVATIKNHVSAILAKLQLDNRAQIALLVQDAERV